MRRFVSMLGLILVSLFHFAGVARATSDEEAYQQIRATLTPEHSLGQLLSNPDIQLMDRGDERQVDVLSRPSVTEELIRNGWAVEVIHPDLVAFYKSLQGALLDYGVWHTYRETIDELNLLHSQYPNITTAPISLGTTGEERDIWAIKISDNPTVEEDDEPEVLYDGMHHAREIMTVEICLYFARYLCENYGTDPVSTFLVDNRQIWFIPIVNPDGFAYNEETDPDGGGMWRKNRRPGPGGCYGVDNNRNYPFQWGGDGSSGDPCVDNYRGPSPGSEPENQALMGLVNAHHFVTHNSWHSVAGMVLIPWGYTLEHTPDDARLRQIATEMSRDNGYTVGQAPEILYVVSGSTTDWVYGAQTEHPRIFTFSTEIGGSGFWPAQSERDDLLAENLHSILYTTQIAGGYVTVPSLVISDGNGRMDPGDTIDLLATARNDGLAEVTGLSIRLTCDDPYVVMLHASDAIGTLASGQSWENTADPFRIQIEPDCPIGRNINFMLITDGSGGIHNETPYTFPVGELPTIYANDFETASDWVQDATHTAYTGAFVRIDPIETDFQPGDDATPGPGVYALVTAQNPSGMESIDDVDLGVSAIRSPDFDLSGYPGVRLSMNYFHGQRDTGDDPGGDYFSIDVSSDAGATWVNLVRNGDVASSPAWQNLVVDLSNFITLTSQVRLRVRAADRSNAIDTVEGGIDDVYLYSAASPNEAPGAPTPLDPPDGGDVASSVTLVVGNANDPEGDPLTYGFRVYSDADLTNLVASASGIPQGATATSWEVDAPLESGTYYWRAYAADPRQRGLYGSTWSFHFRGASDVADMHQGAGIAVTATPNPARAGIRIRYMTPPTLTSRLAVYDPQGRAVRDLPMPPSAAGWHDVVWDGLDDAGRRVPSGSYWVRLWTPGVMRTVRVVRID
jgi:carboxypeptidase T